jgi:hypothetical protein
MTDIQTWGAFLKRILGATERRISNGDIEGLKVLADLESDLDGIMRAAIRNLRAEPWNYSWTDVARVLGVTRQAARQRFMD